MPLQEIASKYGLWTQELPPEVEALAREQKAFQRGRRIQSVADLWELVVLYSMADLTAREIAGVYAGRGKPLSDEAVRHRLAACPAWLAGLLGKLLPASEGPARAKGSWQIVICDGSQISGPGATGTDYRWHVAYDPVAQQIAQLHLSDVHTGESLQRYTLGPGQLVLGDRAYAKAPALVATRLAGAHVVVRMSPQYLKVETLEGMPLDIVATLRAAGSKQQVSMAGQVREARTGQVMPVWLHAHHLSPEQVHQARRRAKRQATRRGRTPRAQTLFLSEWVIVLTTVPPEELAAEVILDLYRVRWQVELVIKRYKSLLAAACVRAKAGSPLAVVSLLGKLLLAVLIERRALSRLGNAWTQMRATRQGTWWRVWKLLTQEFRAALWDSLAWWTWDWAAVLGGLTERPRKRQLQRIPAAVAAWLDTAAPDALPEAA